MYLAFESITKISSVELSTTVGSSTDADGTVVVVVVVIVDIDDTDDVFNVGVGVGIADSAAAAIVVVDVAAVAAGVAREVVLETLFDSIAEASCSFWRYVRDESSKCVLRLCGC